MTRTLIATIGALGLAVSAAAQPPQPQEPRPATPPAAIAMAEDVKLTGCLKAGAAADTFELQRGKKDQGATTAAAASAKGVKLIAAAGVDLASHVGHTVELSGAWSPASEKAADASAAAGKTFTVSNVKMVSATCTTGTN